MSVNNRTKAALVLLVIAALLGCARPCFFGCPNFPSEMEGEWKLLWSGRGEDKETPRDEAYLLIEGDKVMERIAVPGTPDGCFEINVYSPARLEDLTVRSDRQERSYSPPCGFGSTVVSLRDPIPFMIELRSATILTWQQATGDGTLVAVYKKVPRAGAGEME